MADQKPDVLSPLISYLHDHLTAMVREMGADRAVRNPENFIREIDRARAVARGAGILTMEVPHTALLQGVLGEIDDSMERAYSAAGAIAELTSLSFPTESFALPVVELAHRAAQEIEGALEALSVYRSAAWPASATTGAGVGALMEAEYDADGTLVGLRPAPDEEDGEEDEGFAPSPSLPEQIETARRAEDLASDNQRLSDIVQTQDDATALLKDLAAAVRARYGSPEIFSTEMSGDHSKIEVALEEAEAFLGTRGDATHPRLVRAVVSAARAFREATTIANEQQLVEAVDALDGLDAAEEQHPAEDAPAPGVETVS